jgi:hypothetical protein
MADQFHDTMPVITNQIAEDIPDIAESLGFLKDVFENFCLGWSNTDATGIYPKSIKRTALTSADSPYAVLATDTILECNGAGGAIECDLQAAATAGAGRFHIVKATSVSGGSITVDPDGSEELEGASSSYTLDQANEAILIYCTGAAWFLISHYRPTLSVDNGGTGATTFTDGGILLGSGTSAITALGVAANGEIPIGDGTTDPQLATITAGDGIDVTNGAASITVAADLKANGGLVIEATEVAVDLGASSITGTLAVSDGGTGLTASPITVPLGGSGLTTITDHGVLLGSGTAAVSVTDSGSAGEVLVSGGAAADPDWSVGTGTGVPVRADSPTFTTKITTPEIENATAITIDSTGAGVNITTHSDAGDDFTINTTALVVEGDTGEVGIGTASPGDNLEIDGTDPIFKLGNRIRIRADESNNDAWFGWGTDLNVLKFGSADFGSPVMTLESAGNVGIGTITPETGLDIASTATSTTPRFKVGDSWFKGDGYYGAAGTSYVGYQTVASGSSITVGQVEYSGGSADSKIATIIEIVYVDSADSNRSGYYLFRLGYTADTTATTVTSSVQNSSATCTKTNDGSIQSFVITPTTTGTNTVKVLYRVFGMTAAAI